MNNRHLHTRTMEDEYFQRDDQFLIENLRELKRLEETRENLSTVSGITDSAVLDKLIQLGIHPETLSSLAVIPLITVAWADGTIEPRERQAILDAVHGSRFGKSIDLKLVGHWLETKPKPQLFEAWVHYSQALAADLSVDERRAMREELVGHAREVAEAAGGLLGLGKVSAAETAVLEKLEAAWK